MTRLWTIAILGLLGGCCIAPSGEAASASAPPSTVAPEGVLDPACLGLCERIAGCDRDEGRMPSTPDCAVSCAEGGVYAGLSRTSYACAGQPSCSTVRQCAGPALAMTLLGSIASASPTTAPPDWPEGFPTVAGGVPRAAPAMGPVHVALIAYPGRDVIAIDRAYRDALAAGGWTVTDAPAGGGEANRFVAEHDGSSVSVSLYRDGIDAIVQTMQLDATSGHGGS